ncbi:hypothetical protein COLINT_03649 [Collinsella intestinalis DSM 13280]|jgi:hypothetical protein|uniref:Uncharacterized protein n=1 Tax=Collinsella intestinalis DSM 13280 TaxID=521003 RepID=C4FC30_9ACTN|nr:hypothetical protein COLINT_03649 [Collinsella intestinalis DSM 13280]
MVATVVSNVAEFAAYQANSLHIDGSDIHMMKIPTFSLWRE